MTPRQFTKIALSFSGAVESEHMGHPDFRIGGKIFASLGAPDENFGMVKLTPEQQRLFVEADQQTFQACNGVWGQRGYTNIRLSAAKTGLVQEAQRLAFENVSGRARSNPQQLP